MPILQARKSANGLCEVRLNGQTTFVGDKAGVFNFIIGWNRANAAHARRVASFRAAHAHL